MNVGRFGFRDQWAPQLEVRNIRLPSPLFLDKSPQNGNITLLALCHCEA